MPSCRIPKVKSSATLLLLLGGLSPVTGVVDGGIVSTNNEDWFVLLTRPDGTKNPGECERVQCGGALLARDMVLTAAHCYNPEKWITTAWVGRQAMESCNGNVGRAFPIETMFLNPDFDFNDEYNHHDGALLKLTESSSCEYGGSLDDNNVYATFGQTDMTTPHSDLRLYGFGRSDWGKATTSDLRLQYTNYGLASDGFCPSWAVGDGFNSTYQFCVSPFVSCYGDSGGPLVKYNQANSNYGVDIVGIASFMQHSFDDGKYCTIVEGDNRTADVFGKIDFYQERIASTICKFSSYPPSWCDIFNIREEDLMVPMRDATASNFDRPKSSTLKRMAHEALSTMTRAREFFSGDWFNY